MDKGKYSRQNEICAWASEQMVALEVKKSG